MATYFDEAVRTELVNRRSKLKHAMNASTGRGYLETLLQEVDAALSRLDDGSYGLCEVCHDPIEAERLAADPLVRFCLDHLTAPQQRALEQVLDLAASIQSAMLPKDGLVHGGWSTAYHYQAAGPVSGDYIDLIPAEDGSLWFIVGDVSGKGVAASMLMSNLQAMFRTLAGIGLPLNQMMERASRMFCESTLSNHYATLVCGRAEPDGAVHLCNAGHPAALLGRGSEVRALEAAGLPLGMFCSEVFTIETVHLDKGDRLLLYTDGLSEAQDRTGSEFGVQPVIEIMRGLRGKPAGGLVRACVAAVSEFRSGRPLHDDLTLMVIERG